MIGTLDIIDAINDIIVAQYSSYTVYLQEVPSKFDRPSFFIELVTNESEDNNYLLTNEDITIQVMYFSTVDEYHLGDVINVLSVIDNLKGIFKKGYINVQDRAIRISKIQCSTSNEEGHITLDLSYVDGRYSDADYNSKFNNAPPMENIILKQGVDN